MSMALIELVMALIRLLRRAFLRGVAAVPSDSLSASSCGPLLLSMVRCGWGLKD
jgi:hypothetical protein